MKVKSQGNSLANNFAEPSFSCPLILLPTHSLAHSFSCPLILLPIHSLAHSFSCPFILLPIHSRSLSIQRHRLASLTAMQAAMDGCVDRVGEELDAAVCEGSEGAA